MVIRCLIFNLLLVVLVGCVTTSETSAPKAIQKTHSDDLDQFSNEILSLMLRTYGKYLYEVVDDADDKCMNCVELYENQKLYKYVVSAVRQIDPKAAAKVKFLAVDEVLHVALPDGTVVFSRGLLELFRNRHEIAGVFAHEKFHIDQKHLLERVPKGKDGLYSAVGHLMKTGMGKNDELLADLEAVKLLKERGYDPAGYLEFLKRMQKNFKLRSYMLLRSSHPPIADRIAVVAAWLEKEGLSSNPPRNDAKLLRLLR